MNHFNKLSNNLQEIILQKLFSSDAKQKLLEELNKYVIEYQYIPETHNKYFKGLSFYKYMFYEQQGLCGDKCDYCKSY